MKILWFTWKDINHPQAGGAEYIDSYLAKSLVKDGHEVIFLVSNYKGGKSKEKINGYQVIRVGNRFTVYWETFLYFRKNLSSWPDLIIEEINTIPFFTQLYSNKKRLLLIYQLCREIWFYQVFYPLNILGFLLEPLYLRLLNKNQVLTESNSTKQDLLKYGFAANEIFVFPVGVNAGANLNYEKFSKFSLVSLGAIRPMKRTHDQMAAFEMAKKHIPELQFIIAGDSQNAYGKKILKLIKHSEYREDIKYLGRVDNQLKAKIMSKAHLLLSTSVKEGWGLTLTEAGASGTPAVVFNIDGLRDSVRNEKTGLICRINSPSEMAKNIVRLYQDKKLYYRFRRSAKTWNSRFTPKASYRKFIKYAKIS